MCWNRNIYVWKKNQVKRCDWMGYDVKQEANYDGESGAVSSDYCECDTELLLLMTSNGSQQIWTRYWLRISYVCYSTNAGAWGLEVMDGSWTYVGAWLFPSLQVIFCNIIHLITPESWALSRWMIRSIQNNNTNTVFTTQPRFKSV